MSRLEGKAGPGLLSDGAPGDLRLAHTGEIVATDAHGRYHEAVSRRRVYNAALQAGVVLGTALTASATTLTLYNPLGSGVLLSLLNVSAGITAPPAGQAVLVYTASLNAAAAPILAGTPANISCNLLGLASGQGRAFTTVTLPAVPAVVRVLANVSANANAQVISDDVNGAIVLPENTAITIQNIGVTLSGIIAMAWEEVPA